MSIVNHSSLPDLAYLCSLSDLVYQVQLNWSSLSSLVYLSRLSGLVYLV